MAQGWSLQLRTHRLIDLWASTPPSPHTHTQWRMWQPCGRTQMLSQCRIALQFTSHSPHFNLVRISLHLAGHVAGSSLGPNTGEMKHTSVCQLQLSPFVNTFHWTSASFASGVEQVNILNILVSWMPVHIAPDRGVYKVQLTPRPFGGPSSFYQHLPHRNCLRCLLAHWVPLDSLLLLYPWSTLLGSSPGSAVSHEFLQMVIPYSIQSQSSFQVRCRGLSAFDPPSHQSMLIVWTAYALSALWTAIKSRLSVLEALGNIRLSAKHGTGYMRLSELWTSNRQIGSKPMQ